MSWPRGSLLAALLVLSVPLASADTITVNTTTDDYLDNELCSLREAVEYFNLGKPEDGFQGCVAPSVTDTDSITVPLDASPYLITDRDGAGGEDGAIVIQRSLSITGGGNTGDVHTVIKVEGGHRAFVVNDVPTYLEPANYTPAIIPESGAPTLDPADTGASSPTSNLTTTKEPVIQGQLESEEAPVPAGSLMVTVYDVAEDGSKTSIGTTTTFDVDGKWSVQSTRILSPGLHRIVFTTRDSSVPASLGTESAVSPPLQLAIYELPFVREVVLSEMEIIGCVTTTVTHCASNANNITRKQTEHNGLQYINNITNTTNNGGIIYTNEALNLSKVTLHEGHANQFGGAIYADIGAALKVLTSVIHDSSATAGGGATYSERNSLIVSNSLFRDNTASAGAIVEIASDNPLLAGARAAFIENSTIGENTGIALALKKDGVVNVSTIIENSGGIDFGGKVAFVHNTILAGNGASDCLLPAAATITYSLVQTAGSCQAAATFADNQTISNVSNTDEQLIVADATQPCGTYRYGLLCRLAAAEGETASYKPRILRSFTSIASDSRNKIINRGSVATTGVSACPSADQRVNPRIIYACDIGAVELLALTDTVLITGSIVYGQTYTNPLSDELKDEELFDPTDPADSSVNNCPLTPPTTSAYSQYDRSLRIVGCPWVEMPPGRGRVVLNQDGTYTYTPNSDFHGFDRFTLRVITSLSRLNPEVVDQSRLIQVTVIVEPPSGISSSSLGGAIEVWELLLLGVAGMAYRRRQGASS